MRRLALKTTLTTLTLSCGVGLVTIACVLIAQAALRPPLLALGISTVVVRSFGLSRSFPRPASRLASRDDGVDHLLLRAGGPPLAALAASSSAVAVALFVLRPVGVLLATGLAVAGVLLPAVAARIGRRFEAAAAVPAVRARPVRSTLPRIGLPRDQPS